MVVRSDLVALIPFDFPSDLTRGSLTRKGGNMKFCQDGFDSDTRNKFKHNTHDLSTHSRLHAEMACIKIKDFVQPSIRESAWPPLVVRLFRTSDWHRDSGDLERPSARLDWKREGN